MQIKNIQLMLIMAVTMAYEHSLLGEHGGKIYVQLRYGMVNSLFIINTHSHIFVKQNILMLFM
jgi:hypothetical protein